MSILRQAGAKDVHGIDPLPLHRDILRADDAHLDTLADGAYQVVCAMDVIEHVEDDAAMLRRMLRVASEGVFISTPNWNHSKAEYEFHVREYTPAEMVSLLSGLTWTAWTADAECKIGECPDLLNAGEDAHNFGIWIYKMDWTAKVRREVTARPGSMLWARALLCFVREHIKHGAVPTSRVRTPEEVLNGGMALADEMVSAFLWLARSFGIVGWPRSLQHTDGVNGHIVAQIPIGGTMAVVDVQYGVIYADEAGNVVSYESLQAQPQFVAAERLPWHGNNGVGMEGFYAHGPRALNFQIGDVCNAKCVMCWQSLRREEAERRDWWKEMRPEDFEAAVVRHKATLDSVEIVSFGEPMINPGFARMVAVVERCGQERGRSMSLNMITNGSLLDRHAEAIMRLPGCLTVSMDAPGKEDFERIRVGLEWEDVVRGIRAAVGAEGRHRDRRVGINMTVFADNAHLVFDMAAFCDAERVDYLSLLHGANLKTTMAAGREVEARDPRVLAQIADIRNRFPDLRLNDYMTARSSTPLPTGTLPERGFCGFPWTQYDIGPDGRAHPCCRSYGTDLGPATADVWSNETLIELRRQILADDVEPERFKECARCDLLGARVRPARSLPVVP